MQEELIVERIPVFQPCVGDDTLAHIKEALDVGWLGMGAATREFEDRIAAYLGLEDRHVVATNTGTSALHIALRVAGVGPGDEVITPSFNYVADHQAIQMCGAEVVMCDICDDTLGLDVDKAADLITKRTRAIIPLHFAGIPCDMDGVYRLAKKSGLRVVEDAMHAFGSNVSGRRIGSFGDITCFSFDPVKIITSIDGGCVVVNDNEEFETLQRLRILGVDRDTSERYKNRRAWEYDVVSEGYRYHLTNIMAAIGISQIKRVDEYIRSRRAVCQKYNGAFGDLPDLVVPQTDFSDISPFIYSLRVQNGRREHLIQHLQKYKIDTGIHFVPVHEHSQFRSARSGDLTVTNEVVNEVLTLPLHSNMPSESVDRVIDAVTEFFA